MSFRNTFTNVFNQTKTAYPDIVWAATMHISDEISHMRKFGHNDDVGFAVHEDVWHYGGDYNWPNDAGQTMYISSSSALDTVEIVVQGLDQNFREVEETINLQGFTFVPLTGLWSRVHRAYNDNGTDLVGTVYISSDNTDAGGDGIPDVTTAIHTTVAPEFQQTMQAIYTVPKDHTFFVTQLRASVAPVSGGTTKIAALEFTYRPFGKVWRTISTANLQTTGTSSFLQTLSIPEHISEKSDVKIRAIGVGAAAHVDAEFSGILIHNPT